MNKKLELKKEVVEELKSDDLEQLQGGGKQGGKRQAEWEVAGTRTTCPGMAIDKNVDVGSWCCM